MGCEAFLFSNKDLLSTYALFHQQELEKVDSRSLLKGKMKEIPLTQGKVTLVDDDMFEYLNQWKWRCGKGGYALRTSKGEDIYLHHLVLTTPEGKQVDHIDRNTFNNCRSNLRLCNKSENQRNRPLSKNNTSGFKGITYCMRDHVWFSRIKLFFKEMHLGSFKTSEEAAHVYDKRAVELFGEFAWLNFPEEWINRDKEYEDKIE
jgi:AP2 domain.